MERPNETRSSRGAAGLVVQVMPPRLVVRVGGAATEILPIDSEATVVVDWGVGKGYRRFSGKGSRKADGSNA